MVGIVKTIIKATKQFGHAQVHFAMTTINITVIKGLTKSQFTRRLSLSKPAYRDQNKPSSRIIGRLKLQVLDHSLVSPRLVVSSSCLLGGQLGHQTVQVENTPMPNIFSVTKLNNVNNLHHHTFVCRLQSEKFPFVCGVKRFSCGYLVTFSDHVMDF